MTSLKMPVAAALLTLGLTGAAAAAPGYATANVNLRAGPGTDYPVVTTLAAGTGLEIHGCLQGYSWCDVTWRGNRGWISSNYIQAFRSGRRVRVVEAPPPIVTFSFGNYWGNYYRGRPWYRDRDRYEHRYRPAPRPAIRQELRQDRREFRQELRQDQRRFQQEQRQDRRDFRREQRQDRREDRRN